MAFPLTDAAYWSGASLDLSSSFNKRELNPLFRNQAGIFSPNKNLAFKGGLWGIFKLLEFRYSNPNERRLIRWFKIGGGVAWGALAAHNFGVKRVR